VPLLLKGGEYPLRLPSVLLAAFLFIAAATFQAYPSRIIDTNEYGAHEAIRKDDIAKVRHRDMRMGFIVIKSPKSLITVLNLFYLEILLTCTSRMLS
jgi:hypothetical protein